MHNEVSAESVSTVIQSRVINGNIALHHECTSPLVAYLQAAEALTSNSPIREAAAIATLTQLTKTSKEMFVATMELMSAWWPIAKEDEARRNSLFRVVGSGVCYILVAEKIWPDIASGTNKTEFSWREGRISISGTTYRAPNGHHSKQS